MKNTLGLLTLAACGLFVLPNIAKAQATEGAFVNGNIGRASLDFSLFDGNDTSYGVNAGYRWAVSPGTLIGFEVGYVDLGSYSAPTTLSLTPLTPIGTPPGEPVIYPGIVTTKMSGWTIGANSRFNLSPNWYVGGRAGFLRASVDTRARFSGSGASFVPNPNNINVDGWYVGAGFGYDVSHNFSLGLNYDYYSAKKNGLNFDPAVVSVSGEYRF